MRLFLTCIFALGWIPKVWAAMPAQHLPGSAAQGDVLEMQLSVDNAKLKKGSALNVQFDSRTLPCFSWETADQKEPGATQFDCLAGIPADMTEGARRLEFKLNGELFLTHTVEILPTQYPTEILHLSPETKALMDSPKRGTEVKIIRAQLGTESKQKLWDSNFLLPLNGKVESVFGERRILDGKLKPGFHKGLDLGAKEGSIIKSAHHGKVLIARRFSEEGNMVAIDHGQGLVSIYLHCSKILVKKGQIVRRGEVIAKVGTTGVSNSFHLHLGFYIHDQPVNPNYFLDYKKNHVPTTQEK